jgi:holo-[acyl-carrier protein] synthase
MILGIGIDSVDIARMSPWLATDRSRLLRIFHADELAYCFKNPAKTAERLAARFAAREACFKALAPHCQRQLPFLTLCRMVQVKKLSSGAPELIIDWNRLQTEDFFCPNKPPKTHISLTHTHSQATAIIIIEHL